MKKANSPLTILLFSSFVLLNSCTKKPAYAPINLHESMVSTFAGSGVAGSTDGTGRQASFNHLTALTIDAANNLYVPDDSTGQIRKITPAGVVSTLPDNGTASGGIHYFSPSGLAIDKVGNFYINYVLDDVIRKVNPDATQGAVFAGNYRQTGALDGLGTSATFNFANGLTVDASGNIYVADSGNNLIRKITPQGNVTTFAGSGLTGSTDGTGKAASFNFPTALTVDAAGNVYVADRGGNLVRKITPGGIVTTIAGSGHQGDSDGVGKTATFGDPSGIAIDSKGNLFVTDSDYGIIRKIDPSGKVTTIAGNTGQGANDGPGPLASFNDPIGIVVDKNDIIYVNDFGNNLIRKIVVQ
jgi:sugar lactone lactonase YvrE